MVKLSYFPRIGRGLVVKDPGSPGWVQETDGEGGKEPA
jgi:hypothetical protein